MRFDVGQGGEFDVLGERVARRDLLPVQAEVLVEVRAAAMT